MDDSPPAKAPKRKRPARHPVRDTLFFALLLVVCTLAARTFVVEAYVIPSGSMAPTLLGVHRHVRCGACGHAFEVDAAGRGKGRRPLRCPLCREEVADDGADLGGDRILVAKFPARPHRFDVVVFRAPQAHDPMMDAGKVALSEAAGPNSFFIKRAVGLPGEDIHLLDGHVFVRKLGEKDFKIARRADPAQNPRWEAVARAMWRPVWRKDKAQGETAFDFDAEDGRDRSAYDDATLHPYNQTSRNWRHRAQETVEDLRLAATATGPACRLGFDSAVCGPLALVRDGARLELRAGGRPVGKAALAADAAVRLELWLLDREALAFADGRCVIRHAFDAPFADILDAPAPPPHPLDIRFSGGALADLEVDAALPYLAGGRGLEPARGGLVRNAFGRVVMTAPVSLPSGAGDAQACWFCLGDNSPSSTDSRYWNNLHPAVQDRLLGGHAFFGVVPEGLMVGRAACVFWPADDGGGGLPEWGKIRRIR